MRLTAFGALVLIAVVAAGLQARTVPLAGTRLEGVPVGSHAVGFEMRSGVDTTRRINATDVGRQIGLAVWYPSERASGAPLTYLDYRLLQYGDTLSDAERRRAASDEANVAVGWQHVGIVTLTRAQALASLETGGIATRKAPRLAGSFPVVIVLGGPYYLASTAETLASHGFVVVAPFRLENQPDETRGAGFVSALEHNVRDAEWAISQLGTIQGADASRVGALGHGGGGLEAMLLAMSDRGVKALVNIDAGNFSTRTRPQDIPSYGPRLLRVPYLFIATEETRSELDQFDAFLGMKFSDRFEVVLKTPGLRHHDLSDIGRAVTAPLGIRGDEQAAVQTAYADVQEMVVRFFSARMCGPEGPPPHCDSPDAGGFEGWLQGRARERPYSVAVHRGSMPAPAIETLLANLSDQTPAMLKEAWQRDPDAPVFRPYDLGKLVSKALATGQPAIAEAIAAFALTVNPGSPALLEYRSEALEARGETARSAESASACVAAATGDDWSTLAVASRCRDRLARLSALRR